MTEVPHVALQPSPWGDETPSPIVAFPRLRRVLWFVIPAGMLLFILLGTVTGFLVKWLWMRELDYAGIFCPSSARCLRRRSFSSSSISG
jgi:hypothetical protein